MRARRQERYLPPIFVQVFGGAIVLAILVVGIVTLNVTLLLAVLGFAGGCVMIGGYYEKIRHDAQEAMEVEPEDAAQAAQRASDS